MPNKNKAKPMKNHYIKRLEVEANEATNKKGGTVYDVGIAQGLHFAIRLYRKYDHTILALDQDQCAIDDDLMLTTCTRCER